MRILYDHQIFSLQNAGGGSRYFYELMRFMDTVPDVQTDFLLGIGETSYPFLQLSSGNVHVTKFNGHVSPAMWLYAANEVLSNCMAPFLGRMNIYHPTLYRSMPMVRSQRIVATHHDCTQERFPTTSRNAKHVIRAKKSLYAQADAIICVSASARNDLLEFYAVDATKAHVIHHGLTHLPRSAAAAKTLGDKLRRPYLLYVGSRAVYKNFHGLLKAFRETGLHESLDLLVLGGGPLTPEEATTVAQLELGDSIIRIPSVHDELLAEAYAAAALFVYPSLWEGFGFPPLEAMNAGCAVVASNASSIPEVCRDAPFYFNPADQDSFSDALLRGVNDEAARKHAIDRGREVAAGYTWEKCGRETLQLYRECQ